MLRASMDDFVVTVVGSLHELEETLSIRTRVFVDEQGVPPDEEVDGYDIDPATNTRAVHFIGRLAGRPIATARLLLDPPPGDLPHIGRVAVLAEHRGRGYGRTVMERVHQEAHARGFPGVVLGAQLQAWGG
jgi:predicted GNAT family N-acyltransferase